MKIFEKTTMLLMLLASVAVLLGAEKPNILFIFADDQTPESIRLM